MKFQYNSKEQKQLNRIIFGLGLFKIRMIGFVGPRVVRWSKEQIVIRIRLNRRSKNHVNSMYLGALAVGAELAAGVPAAFLGQLHKQKFSLLFKNMECEFIKRSDADVYFEVNEMPIFEALVQQCAEDNERRLLPVPVNAYIHYGEPNQELVATFSFGLSFKIRK